MGTDLPVTDRDLHMHESGPISKVRLPQMCLFKIIVHYSIKEEFMCFMY